MSVDSEGLSIGCGGSLRTLTGGEVLLSPVSMRSPALPPSQRSNWRGVAATAWEKKPSARGGLPSPNRRDPPSPRSMAGAAFEFAPPARSRAYTNLAAECCSARRTRWSFCIRKVELSDLEERVVSGVPKLIKIGRENRMGKDFTGYGEIRIKRVPEELKALIRAEAKRLGMDERGVMLMRLWGTNSTPYGGAYKTPVGTNGTPNGTPNRTPKSPPEKIEKSGAEREGPDARHVPVREFVKESYRRRYPVECTWDGSEAKALDRVLKANPGWTVEQMKGMVENAFLSDDMNGQRPRVLLGSLSRYAGGPLDRFGKEQVAGGSNGRGQEGTRRVSASEQRADDIKRSIINAFTDPIGEAVKPDSTQRKGETRGRLIEGIPKTV